MDSERVADVVQAVRVAGNEIGEEGFSYSKLGLP
jgi:hypothetical protein